MVSRVRGLLFLMCSRKTQEFYVKRTCSVINETKSDLVIMRSYKDNTDRKMLAEGGQYLAHLSFANGNEHFKCSIQGEIRRTPGVFSTGTPHIISDELKEPRLVTGGPIIS